MKYLYNTKERGVFYFLTFKENGGYVAVCLNLDIIEYGEDSEKLKDSMNEAAFSYLEGVRKKNLSDDNLNRFAHKKYWRLFLREAKSIEGIREKIPKPAKSKKIPKHAPDYFEYTKQPYHFSFA